MKVLKSWLQEYITEPLPEISVLVEKLSFHAFEIEGVDELPNNDALIDVDVLPNRAHDCLSHHGIAREVATLFNLTFKEKTWDYATDTSVVTNEQLSVSVETPALVPRVMKRVVVDVHIGDSPDWLKSRLEALGQRSINNVVDITNYVMLETGQPVHAFDYDKVAGTGIKQVIIRGARAGEVIQTLDGQEFTLNEGMLVWADEERALDVAGIKGGAVSGIDSNTKRIMLSACTFNSTTIRKTSRALGLITDASKRFEQGISPILAERAIQQTSFWVHKLAGGRISSDVIDIYPTKQDPYTLGISTAEINKLLGSRITGADVEDILRRLRFPYTKDNIQKENYLVTVPLERLDLMPGREVLVSGNKEDLIEEIGRVYGYNKIEPQLLQKEKDPEVHQEFYYIQKVRDVLVGLGFSEVYTYSFVENGEVGIQNPMASDKAFLRPSLGAGLHVSLEHNLKYKDLLGLDMVQLFEIGTVFTHKREYIALGIAVGGKKQKDAEAMARAVEETLAIALGVKIPISLENGIWETDLSLCIEKLPIPSSYDDIKTYHPTNTVFTPISIYPFVLRDIALWIPKEVERHEVERSIQESAGQLLVRITPFDTYKKEGRISYAFHLVFQSHEKTLSDEEVNIIMEKIAGEIKQREWEVR